MCDLGITQGTFATPTRCGGAGVNRRYTLLPRTNSSVKTTHNEQLHSPTTHAQEYFALEECLGEHDRDFRQCKTTMDMLKKCSEEQRLKKVQAAAALAAGGKPAPAADKQQK
eukprot:evm.model.NODE_1618_length_7447_cov_32.017056.1